MKRILSLSSYSFLAILKSPSAIIFSILFPLIFTFVFGFLNNSKTEIEYVVAVDSMQIASFEARKIPNVRFVDMHKSHTKIDAKLINLSNKSQILQVYSHVNNPQLLKFILGSQPPLGALEIKMEINQTKSPQPIDFILPGQLGFSLLASSVFGGAFLFYNLRKNLVLKRFYITPIPKVYILLSEAISRLLFQSISSILIVLIGYYCLGFVLNDGIESVFYILIVSVLGSLVFMAFGFIISSIANSESIIAPLSNIITLPQFLLAGTFFPIEKFPLILQYLCKILPLTYLNSAIRKIAFDGANLWQVRYELLYISLFGIILYALLPKFFKWK